MSNIKDRIKELEKKIRTFKSTSISIEDKILLSSSDETIRELEKNLEFIVPYMEKATLIEPAISMLTSSEVAEALGFSNEFLNQKRYNLEKAHNQNDQNQKGKVPGIKRGNTYLFSPKACFIWNYFRPKRGKSVCSIPDWTNTVYLLQEELNRLQSVDFSSLLVDVISGKDSGDDEKRKVDLLVDMLLYKDSSLVYNILQSNPKIAVTYMEKATLIEPAVTSVSKKQVAEHLGVSEVFIQNRKYSVSDSDLNLEDKIGKIPVVSKGNVLLFSPQAVVAWDKLREKRNLPSDTFIRDDLQH